MIGHTLDVCECTYVDGSTAGSDSTVFRGGGAIAFVLSDVVVFSGIIDRGS